MVEDDKGQAGIQDFILARELAEVYLLLDNISTAKNKQIPVITDDPLFNQAGKTWIEEVCDIAWPPDADTSTGEGLKAAKLLHAKDILNVEAAPATGASIAFTLMMAGEARDPLPDSTWWRRSLLWLAGSDGGRGERSSLGRQRCPCDSPPTRASLAAQAYPSLARRAWRYRVSLISLVGFLVLWLFLTCYLSWDVATGSSLLNRVNDLDAQITVASKSAVGTTLPQGGAATPPKSVQSPVPARNAVPAGVDKGASPAPSSPAPSSRAPSPSDQAAPAQAAPADPAPDPNNRNLTLWKIASGNLEHWLEQHQRIRDALVGHMGAAGETAATDPAVSVNGSDTNTEWAAVFIGVLAGTILPIFYGLLGAGAAVVRSVSAKMRDSTLMPRDLYLAYVQLALGAVIGACVGLFVTSNGNATPTPGGLLGAVPLSASALCFVAGFGVEGVFQALESLVRRVFNLDPVKTP